MSTTENHRHIQETYLRLSEVFTDLDMIKNQCMSNTRKNFLVL